jgi:hypothetical protein
METFLEYVKSRTGNPFVDEDGADLVEGMWYTFSPLVGRERWIKIGSLGKTAVTISEKDGKTREIPVALFHSEFAGRLSLA